MIFLRYLIIALALTYCGVAAAQQPITLGEMRKLGYADSGNANLLVADGPFNLPQSATLNSISFWVSDGAGELVLGIYDSGPANNCASGRLISQTAAFVPQSQSWNTQPPSAPVTLAPGNYCLAYLPSSNSLSFLKGMTTGIGDYWSSYPFGPMPPTFPASPNGPDGFHWSLFAILTPVPSTPTPIISFSPMDPSVTSNTPAGSVVASVNITISDGSQFTGTIGFGPPYSDDKGTFALSCQACATANILVNPSGPGLSADGDTVQNITVVATQ